MNVRILIAAVAVVVLGAVVAFAVSRDASEDDPPTANDSPEPTSTPTTDATPSLTETPSADATPDLSRPGWYIPYLTADGQLPVFSGEVNGIRVGNLEGSPSDEGLCEEREIVRGVEAEARYADSPVTIREDDLPPGVTFFERPGFSVCGDSVNTHTDATLQVADTRHDYGLGEGSVQVRRFIGDPQAGILGPQERWQETTVSGQPAALLVPVIESVGQSALVMHDPETGVTTALVGQGVYEESLVEIMKGLLQ